VLNKLRLSIFVILCFGCVGQSWAAVNPEAEWVLYCPELRIKWDDKEQGAGYYERPWALISENTVQDAVFDYQKFDLEMTWTLPFGKYYSDSIFVVVTSIKMNNAHLILIDGYGLKVRYNKSSKELQFSYVNAYSITEQRLMAQRRTLAGQCELTKNAL
jgi:hypothetical protein